MKQGLAWIGACVLVVLAARALAYALTPSPLAETLRHRVGGPALPVVALAALGICIAVAAALVWLAALGVRERALLANAVPPPLRLPRLLLRALLLFAAASLGFALLESYLHWRAGLGWHGLRCLTGPVHRDAFPLLAGLSLLAAAVAAALEHVLAWMRRALAAVVARRFSLGFSTFARPISALARGRVSERARARAPPLAVC